MSDPQDALDLHFNFVGRVLAPVAEAAIVGELAIILSFSLALTLLVSLTSSPTAGTILIWLGLLWLATRVTLWPPPGWGFGFDATVDTAEPASDVWT